jgi:4-hydroxy-tetrahydrodipicolinate reductase
MPLTIAVIGARGRMGRHVVDAILAVPDRWRIGALVERPGHPELGTAPFPGQPTLTDDLDRAVRGCGAAIDFSSAAAAPATSGACVRAGIPAVIASTGLSAEQRHAVEQAARSIPVVFSPNMSIGVNLLFMLLDRLMAAPAASGYDVEIVEAHHARKKDAPSGTAARLMDIVAAHRPGSRFVFGRQGMTGERAREEVGVSVIRAGDIVGEHTVMLCAAGERIELRHSAASRDTFARGALEAATWVIGRPPGLYTMQDVLGIQ